jgi:hypothetical protein
LYAHMNNKTIKILKKELKGKVFPCPEESSWNRRHENREVTPNYLQVAISKYNNSLLKSITRDGMIRKYYLQSAKWA